MQEHDWSLNVQFNPGAFFHKAQVYLEAAEAFLHSERKGFLPVRPSPALAFRSDSAPRLPPCQPCSVSPPPVRCLGFQALPASLGCQGSPRHAAQRRARLSSRKGWLALPARSMSQKDRRHRWKFRNVGGLGASPSFHGMGRGFATSLGFPGDFRSFHTLRKYSRSQSLRHR